MLLAVLWTLIAAATAAQAQTLAETKSTGAVQVPAWDLGARAGEALSGATDGKLKLSIEFRGRYESRSGVSFGQEVDKSTALYRTRLGMSYQPVSWLRFSGMVQDSRAPFYGSNAPSNVRDSADLHEAYIELFPNQKRGFGLIVGRQMLTYGEKRVIGSPQWSNLSRTFDVARAFYRLPKARLEFLFASPVKIRLGEFNRPVLGDRVWGAYNSFPQLFGKSLLEVYALRREQNRPGGFTGGTKADGTDRLGVNTFGFRTSGPFAAAWKYSIEGAFQTGKVGKAQHRAAAWAANAGRRWTVKGKPLDVSAEYKFASGTKNPADPGRVGTFDQIYPSLHDAFGHQDLFGWRNIHNARPLASFGASSHLTINAMYSSVWLASRRDALYNSSGKAAAQSITGTAGRHAGQEADVFVTYKCKRMTVGAGYGYFFKGDFVRNTTPGVSPSYIYLFHTYSL